MKLVCPHCSQPLELTPEVLASLQGQPHFECPSCQGLIAAPSQPRRSPASARATATGEVQQGMNRNFLMLGIAALVVLGGTAAFLASRNGGSITNIFQNTTNNIIHNSYFTQLIASGATTLEDLRAIAEIRPYGDGFIGVSKESLIWEQAQELAQKCGAEILPQPVEAVEQKKLAEWLPTNLGKGLQASAWTQENGAARLFSGGQFLNIGEAKGRQHALLRWTPASVTAKITSEPSAARKGMAWSGFNPGPLVFEKPLNDAQSLEKLWRFDGQYGGRLDIAPGRGIKAIYGHTPGMAWAQAVLGTRCRVEFEVSAEKDGWAAWVLKGSGLGNSTDTGWCFKLARKNLTVGREGVEWLAKLLEKTMEPLKWYRVRMDMDGPRIAFWLDDTLIVNESTDSELGGPLHGWFGLSGSSVTYRNLSIHSSEGNQNQERQFLPPPTTAPRDNGELVYEFAEPDGPLGANWHVVEPGEVEVNERSLVLKSSSLAVLNIPFQMPLALEVVHEFDHDQALNFSFRLAHASRLPRRTTECNGFWQIKLPNGSGRHEIFWSAPGFVQKGDFGDVRLEAQDSSLLACTPRFSPVQRQHQTLRLELMGESLRVFVDSRLLIDARRPPDLRVKEAVFIALGQFYSLSKVSSLRVYKLTNTP